MKLKRILSVFLVVILSLSVVACGKKDTAELPPEPEAPNMGAFPGDNKDEWVIVETDAVFEGYKDMPFGEFVKKGITAGYETDSTVKKCEVICHEGWNDKNLVDESSVADGSRPVTYDVEMLVTLDGKDTIVGFKFYMELTPDNILKAVAVVMYQEGVDYGDVWENDEAKEFIMQLAEYVKQ